MTPAQLQLRNLHGTPEQFREALAVAVPDFISHMEALDAAMEYRREWKDAGVNDRAIGAKGE